MTLYKTFTEPLTVPTLLALAKIVEAAHAGARVRRLEEDGRITEGVARRIGDDRGFLFGGDQDVREAHLHVTTLQGMEVWWPLDDLVRQLLAGELGLG